MLNSTENLLVEEDILEIVADSIVNRVAAAEIALDRYEKGDLSKAVIRALVTCGIREFRKGWRYEERLKFKVLKLDSGWYEKVRAELAAKENTPASRRKSEQRKLEEDARSEDLKRQTEAAWAPIRLALSFYEKWHLADGTPLGNATHERLVFEASRERASADGHARNAEFYEAMADLTPQGISVREAVALDVAHSVRERIYRKYAAE